MMQVQLKVEGTTYADLQFKMNQAVQSFLTGAPEGTTMEIDTMGVAVKVSDAPAGWDATLQKIITIPHFELMHRWNVIEPTPPTP